MKPIRQHIHQEATDELPGLQAHRLLPVTVPVIHVVQKQPSEHARQHPDRQEEPRPAGDPTLAIRRDPATGHEAVKMRMVQQILPPGVEHGQEADLRAQMLRISSDGAQRLRGGPEQDVVDHGLVLECDRGD